MTTLDDLATTPTLLVVSDFDGTLAGFNVDPMNVPVNTTSIAALEKLSTMPNTELVPPRSKPITYGFNVSSEFMFFFMFNVYSYSGG